MSKYAIRVEALGKEYIIGGAEQLDDQFLVRPVGMIGFQQTEASGHHRGGHGCSRQVAIITIREGAENTPFKSSTGSGYVNSRPVI